MPARDGMFEAGGEPTPTNLVLRSPPNWTAICFLGALGALHITIYSLAASHGKTEGYMSLIFGCLFLLAALACYLSSFEMMILPSERRIRLRTGYRRLRVERSIPFAKIRAVRLTLISEPDHSGGRIELLCNNNEDIACPPTSVARVEALCLAVTMGVRLIKVSDGTAKLVRWRRRRSAQVDELSPQ